MKITIIGSSHAVPEPHRECCSIMIEVGKNVYFLDMGTPIISALRTRNLEMDAVKGVFITHMHGDHTNGLIPFIDLLTWRFEEADPLICLPVPEAGKIIRAWLDITINKHEKEIRYQETKKGIVYDDGFLRVTALETKHCEKSFAYLVEAESKTVLFTGDLKNPGIDFPISIADRQIDLVICESAHFPATDYLPVFEQCDIKKVCVTHYSDRYLSSILTLCEVLNEKGISALRAFDDLEIRL